MVTLQKHHYTNNPTTLLRMLQYLWHGRVGAIYTCTYKYDLQALLWGTIELCIVDDVVFFTQF